MFNLDQPYDDEVKTFGEKWCGPEKYTLWEKSLVAKFQKSPPDGDGQSVEVYCTPAPARFYELVVLPEPNSNNEIQDGFVVKLGSSQWELAALLAASISDGMLGFSPLLKKE